MQAMEVTQDNENFKKVVNQLIVDYNIEVINGSNTLDRCKRYAKLSLPNRIQEKLIYIWNLVLKRKMRCMKRSLERA